MGENSAVGEWHVEEVEYDCMPGFWVMDGDVSLAGFDSREHAERFRLAPAMERMLRRLEWADYAGLEDPTLYECPVCDGIIQDGHAPDCELDALLRSLLEPATPTPSSASNPSVSRHRPAIETPVPSHQNTTPPTDSAPPEPEGAS